MSQSGDEVIERLARIETKLDGLSEFKKVHEARITKIENRSYMAMGAAIVLPLLGIKLPWG